MADLQARNFTVEDDIIIRGLHGLNQISPDTPVYYNQSSPSSSLPVELSPLRNTPQLTDLVGLGFGEHHVELISSLAAFTAFTHKKELAQKYVNEFQQDHFNFSVDVLANKADSIMWVHSILAFPALWESSVDRIKKEEDLLAALKIGFEKFFNLDKGDKVEAVRGFFIRLFAVLVHKNLTKLSHLIQDLVQRKVVFNTDELKMPFVEFEQNYKALQNWVNEDSSWFLYQGFNIDPNTDVGEQFLCELTAKYEEFFGRV